MLLYNPMKLVRQLQSSRLLRYLERLSQLSLSAPPKGWLHTIRQLLSMSQVQLAKRLQVSPAAIHHFEKGERAGTITLHTLQKAAEALNCNLVYALVPKQPIPQLLQERALKKAQKMLAPVAHTMALEDQGLDPQSQQDAIRKIADELIRTAPKTLWEEDL